MTGKKKARTVNEWLDMEKVDGYTIANAKFLREYNYLYRQLRKQALILYCIGVEMQNYYLSKLMYSAKNQARFCSAVCVQMKTKKVESEYATMFEKNVASIKRRLETIERITKEDIHLTEYEPFFEAVIYDCDDPEDIDYREIAEMAKKWNEEHADLVRQHLDALSAEAVHGWNNHEIACMLADLFKDPCACNQCCIDEWLPYKCDLDCGNVVGVACWEQFVTHYREHKGGDDE